MLKRVSVGLAAIAALLGIVWATDYFAWFQSTPDSEVFTALDQPARDRSSENSSQNSKDLETTPTAPVEVELETVVTDLTVPWSIVFTDANRMLVTERGGSVRVVKDEQLLTQPLITISDVTPAGEIGLMGMVLHPEYKQTRQFYLCYGYQNNGQFFDRVVRLIDNGQSAEIESTIIEGIPAARNHAGCELAFGPDDHLYITTGDALDKQIAQDVDSLGGKILRISADGQIPTDNPFPDSPVFTLGHRNPQGLDWHPVTGELYATEHGPSIFDGPAGGDEINHIIAGENYGWPEVSHQESEPAYVDPLLVFTPAVAPGSAIFYDATQIPQFQNSFFFAALRGESIYQVQMSTIDPGQVVQYQKLTQVNVGRVRELAVGPDGALYFATSNQDGRGDVRSGDDKIYRLTPRSN